MNKIFKALAIVATSFALTACNSSVSSDPKTITNAEYSGNETQYPQNISLVTKQDGDNYVAYLSHGDNYNFTIKYEPYNVNEIPRTSYVASYELIKKLDQNGQPIMNYFIYLKYPDDGNFTKADFENMTSHMIWPLIIRKTLSNPESDAAVEVFTEYARDYMITYANSQNLQGEERANAFASAGKYGKLKHNVNYAQLPKLEMSKHTLKTNDPKSDNSKVFKTKISLSNGKSYSYDVFSRIPPPDDKGEIKEKNQWLSQSLFVPESLMPQAQEIIVDMYFKVKDSSNIDEEIASEYQKRLNTLTRI